MKKNLSQYICLLNCLIVLLFYSHTLTYEWKAYDENIIFQELIFPIPRSFSEIFEYITSFGLNHHFEAANPIYSNISNLRSDPFNFLINLFILLTFQKNSFFYHLLSIFLHLINTSLLFMILNSMFNNFYPNKISSKINIVLTSLLTLFWALHPLNVEAVLLITNWPALLTYALCFLTFLVCLHFNNSKEKSKICLIITFFLFLTALFTCEHIVTLPIIISLYLLTQNNYYLKKFEMGKVFTITAPLFIALSVFVICFFLSPVRNNLISLNTTSGLLTLERIFWLSPQIFFHFLKLIIFPYYLSVDQALFVHLSRQLFEPYAIGCFFILFFFILSLILALISSKETKGFLFFITFVPFFTALLPFLHIISPIYNLASERYLYFPLFFLTLGLGHLVCFLTSKQNKNYRLILVIVLSLITFTYSFRACLRTFEWKNNFTFLKATIDITPNNLLKGYLQESISLLFKSSPRNNRKTEAYNKKALNSLEKALLNYKKETSQVPAIIRFYGLDPKTLTAKTAFLIAQTKLDANNDYNESYKIISPYINNINISNSQTLKFCYNILFHTHRLDEAEQLLLKAIHKNKISPNVYVALSDLYEYKYNNLKETEKYLLLSHKYFPYDALTLFALQRLYKNLNNAERYAYYSYLFGLRIHDITALKDAAYIYIRLGNKNKSKIIINKLLKYYPVDEYTLKIKTLYEQSFAEIKQ